MSITQIVCSCYVFTLLHMIFIFHYFNWVWHVTLVVTDINIFLRGLRKKVCCIQGGITLQMLHINTFRKQNNWKIQNLNLLSLSQYFFVHIYIVVRQWCSPKDYLKHLLYVLCVYLICRLYLYRNNWLSFNTFTCIWCTENNAQSDQQRSLLNNILRLRGTFQRPYWPDKYNLWMILHGIL